ncbi:DinB family protein [Streptomyces boncukensis]|uniref:DinB family protein n=1 Tax=Streptomyces boncukensis TaxID=2711219 RepID=A0A6G4WSL2_9ACTN|nr:DinB family protein [Streptomyces boncukensis]NGO68256.1 DinB family protein [Streptomyces boncukensis]
MSTSSTTSTTSSTLSTSSTSSTSSTPSRRARGGDTPPPRTGGSEAEVLRGFLDYLRDSVAAKVEGAPEPQVRTPGVPSGTNLLGLLNHLAGVERATFLGERVTDWQATFQAAPEDGAADVVDRYRTAVAQANAVLDGCADLGAPLPRARPDRPAPSVRWALTHLIEETGRHAGHADILRELIDGATGR